MREAYCQECQTSYPEYRGEGCEIEVRNPLTGRWIDYCPHCNAPEPFGVQEVDEDQ